MVLVRVAGPWRHLGPSLAFLALERPLVIVIAPSSATYNMGSYRISHANRTHRGLFFGSVRRVSWLRTAFRASSSGLARCLQQRCTCFIISAGIYGQHSRPTPTAAARALLCHFHSAAQLRRPSEVTSVPTATCACGAANVATPANSRHFRPSGQHRHIVTSSSSQPLRSSKRPASR